MSDKLVCIATFADSASANIARSVLDSEGIAACLGAEESNTMLAYVGTALGGVKLLVFEDQAAKARTLLAAHHAGDLAEEFPPELEEEEEESEEAILEQQLRGHARRAWYAAVIGTVFCPPLFNLYSLYLLTSEGLLTRKDALKSDWRPVAALVLNVAVLAACGLVWVLLALNSGY